MSSPPVLRPLGVGEILGTALVVYRRHASSLWRVVAVVVALPAALNGALAVAERQVRDSDGSSGSLAVLQALVLVVSLVASCLATAATFRLVVDAYLGRTVDPGRVAALRPAAPVVGDLGLADRRRRRRHRHAAAWSCPGVYLFVAWSVAVPVLLSENLRGMAALRRSRELVRGRWWSCAGVLVLAFLLALIVAARDPRRADRDLRLGRQRHARSSSSRASRA